MPAAPPRLRRRWVSLLLFAAACLADAFVLHTGWTGERLAAGQFRRGYFERFDGSIGLAMDAAVRPNMIPSFVVTPAGDLAVPPGIVAVAALRDRAYTLSTPTLIPYVVVGAAVPTGPPVIDFPRSPSDARLRGARTLAVRAGRLVLAPWRADRPWEQDTTRLAAVRRRCAPAAGDRPLPLMIALLNGSLEIRLGSCTLHEPLPTGDGTPVVAALAGPAWLDVGRSPGWQTERWVIWPILAAVVCKNAALWWSLGVIAAFSTAAALGAAALFLPVPAMLTWPLMLVVALVAAAGRALLWFFSGVAPRWRLAAALALAALAAALAVAHRLQEEEPHIARGNMNRGEPDRCVIIGYSTVKGEGLRREVGGIRDVLNQDCAPCRHRTAGIAAGGETLAWLRKSFCASQPSVGAGGHVAVLGGANDDFLSGVLAIARLFLVSSQGPEAWRRSQETAAAASRGELAKQQDDLAALMRCVQARGAHFHLFHDFLVTDLVAGRNADRAAMLAARRAVVEAGGGTFVDLLAVFRDQVGIAWFNDYVHFSRVGHERIAALACAAFE